MVNIETFMSYFDDGFGLSVVNSKYMLLPEGSDLIIINV